MGLGFGSNCEAMKKTPTEMIAKFSVPRPGESFCVVNRYRKTTPQMVPILKVGRTYVHLASRYTIPLQDLVTNGFHSGANEDYWISSSLYETNLSNQVLLNGLKAQMAQLKPLDVSSSDIHSAARILGLQLS